MDTLDTVSTKMQQIAQNAERMPQVSFTSLSHHLDSEWMYEAYKETRKDGAVGVDGQTAEEFQVELRTHSKINSHFPRFDRIVPFRKSSMSL